MTEPTHKKGNSTLAGPQSKPVLPKPSAPIDRVLSPFQRFLRLEAAGGITLIIATVLALAWANSPWSASYTDLFSTKVVAGVGSFVIDKALLLWINDGLMAIFFLLVGLEIKRELLVGELSSFRKAMLPAAAAIGGMAGPALIFVAINWGSDAVDAWGVSMATDIAFAVGVIALLGSRVPIGLKVFLVALAIVDDLGAVAVVALVYTDTINTNMLLGAGGVLVALIVLNIVGVRRLLPYVLLGIVLWVLVLKSGVHATVAGIAVAMCVPARVRLTGGTFRERLRFTTQRLDEDRQNATIFASETRQSVIHDLERDCEMAQAPLLRLEHALLPWVSFLIMPAFALANAGVDMRSGLLEAIQSPITIGIACGLFLGNQIGITAITWIMLRLGVCTLPAGVTMKHVYGAACLAGIGFTMSLFIAGLAFDTPAELDTAKVGIMLGSLASGILGVIVLMKVCGNGAAEEPGPTS